VEQQWFWRVAAVTVFIGLLLTVGVRPVFYFAQVGKSQVATVRAQIDALNKAFDSSRIDVGTSDERGGAAGARRASRSGEPNWAGPLKKGVPSTHGAGPTSTSCPAGAGVVKVQDEPFSAPQ